MSYPRTPTTTTSAATTTPNETPNEPYDASPATPTVSATPSASTPSKPPRITHRCFSHRYFRRRIPGRFAWPPPRRENGGAAVRDADLTVMPMSSCRRMAPGTTDRNCRLLLEHEGQTLSPCGSSGRPRCCCPSEEWSSDG